MTDWTELKRLAAAALRNWPDSKLFDRPECDRFIDAARPDVVLTLIAENERLSGECEGCPMSIAAEMRKERDQLRAEVEAVRKDAERYQWLRDSSQSIHQFYLSTPIWLTGVKFSKENVDSTIDAAMSKGKAGG